MLRLAFSIVAALLLIVPAEISAQGASRQAKEGFVYLGSAPGFNFGGDSLPRALYMDLIHAGYVLPTGLDLSLAISGMNFFPDEGDFGITMSRLSVGFRPFMRDPMPMVQPYAFAGTGLGAEGRYTCEPEPSCDPSKDACRDICSRTRWVVDFFMGAGLDLNTHLFWLGQQQFLFYTGVQARYEWIFGRYHMPVVTVPFGFRLQ